jgi:Domain of unknown function (DUF5069)
MSTYPKTPREMTSGMMYFPRMLGKIRLHARGELTEDYHASLGEGFDKRCVGFLREIIPSCASACWPAEPTKKFWSGASRKGGS